MLLQAITLAQAPQLQSFSTWVRLCWRRSIAHLADDECSPVVQSCDERFAHEGNTWGIPSKSRNRKRGKHHVGSDTRHFSLPMARSPSLDSNVPLASSNTDVLRQCCLDVHALGWLSIVEPTVSSMLHAHLHVSLHQRCVKRFDETMLNNILVWLRSGVSNWLRVVLVPSDLSSGSPSATMHQWLARLRFFLFQSLASLRIQELFDLIKEYPDSLPAISDLKACLIRTHQHSEAAQVLARAIDSRLLKPGADTANIIQVLSCGEQAP
jgi:hypothetical protein